MSDSKSVANHGVRGGLTSEEIVECERTMATHTGSLSASLALRLGTPLQPGRFLDREFVPDDRQLSPTDRGEIR